MITMNRFATALLFLTCAACVSAPPSRSQLAAGRNVRPSVAPAPVAAVDAEADAKELRSALEDAYGRILARSGSSSSAPVVDADASLSMELPDHRTIRGAINYFSTDLHDSIQESLTRSTAYRPMIEKALDEYKLPHGLAYLPVIESAYVPTLTSRSGAHGIWQFMPATAREMGLRVDWWVDERADPEKSTRAAAAYLKNLYNTFGDWSLALAAYNCGPGRVKRAMNESGATTFWQLLDAGAVPKETRGYVPTFFATLVIVSDPPTYGFRLTEPADNTDQARVAVQGPVSLAWIANVANVDESVVKSMNPQYRRGILPPGRNYVKVPKSCEKTVTAQADTMRLEDTTLDLATFTLRSRDSLTSVSRALKVPADEILGMNGIGPKQFRAGETVYLPVKQRELSALLRHSEPVARYYTVHKGDTLFSIARKHGITVAELTDLNDLGDHTIHPGDRLRVSTGGSVATGGM